MSTPARWSNSARRATEQGLDLAYGCGAGRLAQRATDELRATGARPWRASLTGLEALTPSERRVAELAAAGMSNPEIAQAVFVTLNTVEGHLRQRLPEAFRQFPRPAASRHAVGRPPAITRGQAAEGRLISSNITVPPWRERAAPGAGLSAVGYPE